MMNRARLFLILLFVFFFSTLFIATASPETPKKGGTLIIGTLKDPQGIDIHKDMSVEGIVVVPQILDGLLNIDDEGNLIPGLAVSMPEQPDPKTYIFTLRKGVKFHNGADFDAQDVKFSFDRLMNKEISLSWKTYQALIKSVEIIDPYKVKITLNDPNVVFLQMIGRYSPLLIIPRSSGANITQPIGTGPFKFKEWIKDDRLVLVKNENYWMKGLPYLDQIIYKPFPEPTTRVINLKTAKVDLVHNLPIQDAVELKKDSHIKVISRTGGWSELIYFNTTKPPFDNKKLRQAIAYGIDRQSVIGSVFLGFSEVAEDLFPSWYWAHNPNIKAYPYDPEKAKTLLKEAGFTAKNPFSFTVLGMNDPLFTDQAVIIQAQLAKIGVKMDILAVEKSYRTDAQYGRKGLDYEVMILDMSDEMTDLQWVHRVFHGKSYYNWVGYNCERLGKKGAQNPEVERLLDEITKTADRGRARKMYDEVQKMIIDDVPLLKLSYDQNLVGMRDYVKNHKVLTRNTVPLKEVWVEK